MGMNEPMLPQQQQQQQQQQVFPEPNVKNSIKLMLVLLDDVVQRQNLNLPVQVQAIQALSQSVKVLADVIDRPDQGERIISMLARSNPQVMQQVGQMNQPRTDATPATTQDMQRFENMP